MIVAMRLRNFLITFGSHVFIYPFVSEASWLETTAGFYVNAIARPPVAEHRLGRCTSIARNSCSK